MYRPKLRNRLVMKESRFKRLRGLKVVKSMKDV